jgi:putative flippase GtrA
MAEIEIGVLKGQCLDRRIESYDCLVTEIDAWQRQRNQTGASINWMFSTDKARSKMARAYPAPTFKESQSLCRGTRPPFPSPCPPIRAECLTSASAGRQMPLRLKPPVGRNPIGRSRCSQLRSGQDNFDETQERVIQLRLPRNTAMRSQYSRGVAIITRHLATLLRFSSVGVIATLVYFAVSNGLIVVGWSTPAWASLFGYFAGMMFSFLGQSQFTFRTGRVTTEQIFCFFVLSTVGISISYGGTYILVTYPSVTNLPATVIVAALIALCSFVIMNIWIFKRATPDQRAT